MIFDTEINGGVARSYTHKKENSGVLAMKNEAEKQARIWAAADMLYEELHRERFPTVTSIRKLLHVSAHDASSVMRQWRKTQMVMENHNILQIPDTIKYTYFTALANLWQEAKECALKTYQDEQKAWNIERSEADELNKQLIDAYEEQMLAHDENVEYLNSILVKAQEELVEKTHELEGMRATSEKERQMLEEKNALCQQKMASMESKIAHLTGQNNALKEQNTALLQKLQPQA